MADLEATKQEILTELAEQRLGVRCSVCAKKLQEADEMGLCSSCDKPGLTS